MSLNAVAGANRVHIGFFGRRNAGKSSLVNAVTGQKMSVVSERRGTTTDPVMKSMELLPLGPVVIIDTPGYDDDDGELGQARVARAQQMLGKVEIAVLVVDATAGLDDTDRALIALFEEKKLPWLMAVNKSDLPAVGKFPDHAVYVSALTGEGVDALREKLGSMAPRGNERRLIGDFIKAGDQIVMVMPIDEAAPKGRIILPQQQALRDILDAGAMALSVQPAQLPELLDSLKKPPVMVVTDSQAFKSVAAAVPDTITLTSFSILMARYKGFLETAVRGVAALKHLQSGDKVLIAEGCTHHRQCNDIGTVKIPRWIQQTSGQTAVIDTCSGTEFPQDLTGYRAVVHCGGCMLNEREVLTRRECAQAQGVPFTNYGLVIAQANGILRRSLSLFPELQALIDE